jgi:alginate O-acetyltransferase complex protein AlgI
MVFSSILFLLYFAPVFFLGYYLLPNKYKNGWLVLSSVLFYYWGAPTFFFIFILSCAIDYYAMILYEKRNKNIFFYTAIISNVGLLLYFKYFNFFSNTINEVFNSQFEWTHVVLPIGISFVTFQKISYLIDVKRKDCEPQRYLHKYVLYIVLFPQLIAGPIVRYKEISEQLNNRFNKITTTNIYIGLRRFIIGLSKKVLIANIIGVTVDEVFNFPVEELSSSVAMLGLLGYTFQIYFDFSGYSDMAIGLGKMLGFTFPENFNFPYIAKSITDFWRRWHITLSNWMRDYLYIPLGGNKKGNIRTYLNLFIVFLISGLWHGASWNFVVWGAYHGFFLIIERLFLLSIIKKIPSTIAILYNFVIVAFGWLLFRSASLDEAIKYLNSLIYNDLLPEQLVEVFSMKFYFIFALAIFFSFVGVFLEKQLNEVNQKLKMKSSVMYLSHVSMLLLSILCLAELFSSGFNPFIYFRF